MQNNPYQISSDEAMAVWQQGQLLKQEIPKPEIVFHAGLGKPILASATTEQERREAFTAMINGQLI